ncbi:hypothetical protein SEA_WEASELS2_41 [Rhodococcus phage Weasels2]|uniref:Uncharacterized protein n=1 Tax=Rhodococcus phage Weasels2 TaxID=1897437 RepID=A0A1I9SA25_9CAUD|nr:hypothetical protein FDH04_gp041 [Rhodococcus phage Weasels2]AOZ63631.1 hypothetical protein SEA_WEASELS2_41 [Rhodococcus phage Weasels2]
MVETSEYKFVVFKDKTVLFTAKEVRNYSMTRFLYEFEYDSGTSNRTTEFKITLQDLPTKLYKITTENVHVGYKNSSEEVSLEEYNNLLSEFTDKGMQISDGSWNFADVEDEFLYKKFLQKWSAVHKQEEVKAEVPFTVSYYQDQPEDPDIRIVGSLDSNYLGHCHFESSSDWMVKVIDEHLKGTKFWRDTGQYRLNNFKINTSGRSYEFYLNHAVHSYTTVTVSVSSGAVGDLEFVTKKKAEFKKSIEDQIDKVLEQYTSVDVATKKQILKTLDSLSKEMSIFQPTYSAAAKKRSAYNSARAHLAKAKELLS